MATISQAGAVYYTRFREANAVESCKLAFSDFRAKEGQRLQADARDKLDPD